jgi:hypothetical protein
MATLDQSAMATWEITYRPNAAPDVSEELQAAYPCGADNLPGWTVLKDHKHQIVKMVRDDVVAVITRLDS